MKSNTAPSACTMMRPDASGNLVAVGIARPAAKAAVVRSGPFVIWDDQCQTTRAGDTLAACAEYLCSEGGDEEVVRVGHSGPQPLNSAERAVLRRLIQEGSE